ncbi:MAG: arsenic resistance N-acetyltransferase ArsN2 [Pseudomonadota bacterium]
MNVQTSPDANAVKALLQQVNLPTEDITPTLTESFIGHYDGLTLIGVVGYEPLGNVGLLRSLAVHPTARRGGLGAKLVAAIEALAAAQGVNTLYLLTTDAEAYFAHHGFARVEREQAPVIVQKTEQFSSLCPGSATVMRKSLDESDTP